MKVAGSGGAKPPSVARAGAPSRVSSGFRVEDAARTSAGDHSAAIAESAALGALIALQSDGRGKSKNRAAAERLLVLLERLRDGLAAGRITLSDLDAIAYAADAKLTDPDPEIAALYGEIALRARIELAKLGRA